MNFNRLLCEMNLLDVQVVAEFLTVVNAPTFEAHLFQRTKIALFCTISSITRFISQRRNQLPICILKKFTNASFQKLTIAHEHFMHFFISAAELNAIVQALAPVDALSWSLPFLLDLERRHFFAFFGRTLHISTYLQFLRHHHCLCLAALQLSHLSPTRLATAEISALRPTLDTRWKVKVEKWVWGCRTGRADGEFQEHIIGWQSDRERGRDAEILDFVKPHVLLSPTSRGPPTL